MPLTAANFVNKGPVLHADLLQFYSLFTGAMTDQPVTFSNAVSIGGNQASSTVPLKIFGQTGQTTHLLDLYVDHSQAQPGFGFSALGSFGWGPSGVAPQDTFLSRVATQHGHASDTAGLLVTPYLEVVGNISAAGYLFSNGASITGPGGTPSGLLVTQDLTVNRKLNIGSANEYLRNPTGAAANLSVESSDGRALLSSLTGAGMSTNAYWDGVNWQRWNPGAASILWGSDTTGVALYASAAASGAIAWTTALTVNSGGTLTATGDVVAHYLSTSDGANGVLSARNGNLYLRSAGGAGGVYVDTGTGGLLVTSGGINCSSYIAAGTAISGTAGDLNANRGGGVGYVWLGNASHSVSFDGSSYQMPNSPLVLSTTDVGDTALLQVLNNGGGGGSAATRVMVRRAASENIDVSFRLAGATFGGNDGWDISMRRNAAAFLDINAFGHGSPVLTLDAVNMRVGVNNNAPTQTLDVGGAVVGASFNATGNGVHGWTGYTESISPGEPIGRSGTVVLATHAYVNFDLGVGHNVTCVQVVQTSDPNLKTVTGGLTDADCMARVRNPAVPVTLYQVDPPSGTPQPPFATPNNIGFNAPDLYANSPEFCATDSGGQPVGINYANISALLWGALRDLDARCVAFGI